MRGTREEVAENRRRIVETASRLFRRHGYDRVSVTRIMEEVGLTHGGFYTHFASKRALEAEASALAFDRSSAFWAGLRNSEPQALAAMLRHYLSRAHVDEPGSGCILPALCAEAERSEDATLAEAFSGGVRALAAEIAAARPGGEPEDRPEGGSGDGPEAAADPSDAALFTLSAMAGAVLLTRSVGDRALGDRILAATLRRLERDLPKA